MEPVEGLPHKGTDDHPYVHTCHHKLWVWRALLIPFLFFLLKAQPVSYNHVTSYRWSKHYHHHNPRLQSTIATIPWIYFDSQQESHLRSLMETNILSFIKNFISWTNIGILVVDRNKHSFIYYFAIFKMWLKFVIHLGGNSYCYVSFMHLLAIFSSYCIFVCSV